MPLSWNEIRSRAIKFSKEWENETNEDAEAKSFLDDFFDVFGISRRRVASFEKRVKKIDGKDGYIDMLWKGQILIEQKSKGKSLDKAYKQAVEYFPGLTDDELPRYILVCDFASFRLFDLEEDSQTDFALKDFHKNVKHFGFLIGMQQKKFAEQDPVNIRAAEKMGKLHDSLEAIGYEGHALELYLVRLVFCLFADDTGIFERDIFHEYIKKRTNPDGSDLAASLAQLFYILNTEEHKRLKNLDEDLTRFPYVNGKLFEETLPPASFDSSMRNALLDCCAVDWSKISPAIFGSLFQSVMNPKERRNLGAHYTSEKNILKLIKPLFLDELWQQFEKVKSKEKELNKLHDEISQLRFLDPACGCGNFLIVAYRELRLLELEILRQRFKKSEVLKFDLDLYVKVNVDRFYGIEYEEFPAQIAQVAMWLMDHQMNTLVSTTFGENYVRLPLRKSATIKHGNALRIDWQTLIDPIPWEKKEQVFDYIMGNPPFIGKSLQGKEQKEDIEKIFTGVNGAGVLDYVTCWYLKAAKYLQENNKAESIKCAFVSTNSISQGEQVGILWNELFNKYHIKIHFAHQTFLWNNEAKGNAAVHVVIVGFSNFDINEKILYDYENLKGEPNILKIKNINPYLVEGNDNILFKRLSPICPVPQMSYGSMPNEGGFLLMNENEKNVLVAKEPNARKFIRKFVMGEELINNIPRYCLWLVDAKPEEINTISEVKKRVEEVYKIRNSSTREATNKLAQFPTRFGEMRQPTVNYIALPRVSSVNRRYIPITILEKEVIAGDKVYTIQTAERYVFGMLIGAMHMAWMRVSSGRLKSDYSYSTQLTYNNYPWPENPTEKQKQTVEEKAQQVLDVRAQFPQSSLADLYDPLTMPPALVKAHNELDKAVDLCYRPQPFPSETKRIEFLFELYDKYTSGLFAQEGKKKKK